MHYLDVRGGDLDTAKAAIVIREEATKEGFEGLLKGFETHYDVHDAQSGEVLGSFKTRRSAQQFAESGFPIFHTKMLQYADTVGVTQIVSRELRDAAGINMGRTWSRMIESVGGTAKDAETYAVNSIMGSMPGVSEGAALDIYRTMKEGGESVFFDPSKATEHTAAHEITHTLTGKVFDFGKERRQIPVEAINELIDEISASKETQRYVQFPEWIRKPHEFATEVVTHYLLGNLKPGSRLTQLAEAIIRSSDDPGIRSMLGKSLSVYFAIKGFSSMLPGKKESD